MGHGCDNMCCLPGIPAKKGGMLMAENETKGKDRSDGKNREYKSDVFSMLLEYPENALAAYNAINHSNYTDPQQVEICTLDRGISLSVRNDASFILDTDLSIYEHQSTVCRNMPLRSLIYFSAIISDIVKGKDIYGYSLVKIPTPRFVVFYNGGQDQPEQSEMRLSDAYERRMDQPELELICKVYNINIGKNKELLEHCRFLKEYVLFVDRVRENYEAMGHMDLEQCIEKAINSCIREDILREFLIERRTEVLKMMTLDYTFERRLMLQQEEAREAAEKAHFAGVMEGREDKLWSQIQKKQLKGKTNAQIADELETTEEEIAEIIKKRQ